MSTKKIVTTSGKRKTAIARAVTRAGKGRIRINSIPLEIYQPELARLKIMEPIKIAGDKVNKIDIDVNVKGGGFMGQADAIRTAIAKGIVKYFDDKDLKEFLLKYDRSLLVNDPRRKEPKHQLGRGARKKRQKSYR
ncbi:MAG TPA: 30S ribosomal protein S9 [Thermoplasmata archaeon]|nr:30S ribosomal protein S9 [Thermoplasmata archaeon]